MSHHKWWGFGKKMLQIKSNLYYKFTKKFNLRLGKTTLDFTDRLNNSESNISKLASTVIAE